MHAFDESRLVRRSYYEYPCPFLTLLVEAVLRLNNDATRTEETTVEVGESSLSKKGRKESAHQLSLCDSVHSDSSSHPGAEEPLDSEPAFKSIALLGSLLYFFCWIKIFSCRRCSLCQSDNEKAIII